jgi:hypothetical protein
MRVLGLKPCHWFAGALLLVPVLPNMSALADSISPGITSHDEQYSQEPPNSAYFGTGAGSRLAEASSLRFFGEQDLDNGKYEAAIPKLAKAVQLDSGDPTGHVLYARALTRKIIGEKAKIDAQLLSNCIREWKLIWRHDADQGEQAEARFNAKRLLKLERMLAKQGTIAHSDPPDKLVAAKELPPHR